MPSRLPLPVLPPSHSPVRVVMGTIQLDRDTTDQGNNHQSAEFSLADHTFLVEGEHAGIIATRIFMALAEPNPDGQIVSG